MYGHDSNKAVLHAGTFTAGTYEQIPSPVQLDSTSFASSSQHPQVVSTLSTGLIGACLHSPPVQQPRLRNRPPDKHQACRRLASLVI